MKQYSSLLICLLVAFSGQSFGKPTEGANGDCPNGLANGAQFERGRGVYECQNGNIVPKACVADDLKQVPVGSTVDRKEYRLKCALGSDGSLSIDAIACLHQGMEHKLDEEFEDGSNFYTCKKGDNNDLKVIVAGCVDQGRRVALNDKITKDDFELTCNGTVNNGARLMPSGCVKEGKTYGAGQTFESGRFFFTCTRTGSEKLAVKASGCVNNGQHINDGDRFTEADVIYECIIENGKTEIRTVACAQRDERGEVVERRLGCTWVEGQEPFQYEWACQSDPATNSAKKVQVRCNYKVGGGVYNIEPGCYRVIDKSAFGCSKDGAGLRLQNFQGDQAEKSAQGAGLHAC
jgi:hypothetical protein